MSRVTLNATIDRKLLDDVVKFGERHGLDRNAALDRLVRLGLGRRVQLGARKAEAPRRGVPRDPVQAAADRAERRIPREWEKWR